MGNVIASAAKQSHQADSIGDLLTQGLGSQLVKRFEVEKNILDVWPAVLPRHLAFVCRPAMLIKGVLTVECDSPSYLFDLHWDSRSVLARLREHAGSAVRKLNLVLAGHV